MGWTPSPGPGSEGRRLLVAAVCVTTLLAGGCGFEPVREVESLPPEPEAVELAFVDSASAAQEVADSPPTPTPTTRPTPEPLPAQMWRMATDGTSVGAYSAPDVRYTRVGVLEPDDIVLATGQRVEKDGVIWMEITWENTTAWVLEIAFTPTPA